MTHSPSAHQAHSAGSSQPLRGLRVLATRPAEQIGKLSQAYLARFAGEVHTLDTATVLDELKIQISEEVVSARRPFEFWTAQTPPAATQARADGV